jgi:putative salt-induced outer membrane protein YdiY
LIKTIQYALFPILFFSNSAIAIVNIENMRIGSDKQGSGFDAKVTLDVNGKNGNTKKIKAGFGSRLQWYEENSTRFVVLNYEYGESVGIKDTDKSFFHSRNIWHQSDLISWELFAQLESNEFTRLSLRSLLGGGVRLNLINDSENQAAYFGLGFFRSKEDLDQQLGATDSGVDYASRANLYLVYKYKISSHSRLANTFYYQPDISEMSDYRLLEQFGLQVDINDQLAFKVSIDMVHDNRPPQNIIKTDTSYNTGFEYRF